jgi:glycosyltransferase involved in cell wall biosynthesis
MPTILLLCEYATLHGGERSMLSTLAAARAGGFEPLAAAPPAGPLAEALALRGVEVVPFALRDQAGNRRPQVVLREELADLLDHLRPHLLHANSLAMGRLSGPVAADRRVPSLSHLRDIVTLSRQAVADLNCHGRLLAVSRAVRGFHVAQGLLSDKVEVLHNGVDLEEFCPRPPCGYLHQELSISPDAPLVGAIGQISLRKGQDVLIEAARLLPGDFGAHWLIVGQRFSEKEESRRFEADLRAAVTLGPLAGQFHFLGYRDDVPRLLNELTLLVHPARQEPLGRVLLEAAAAGVAVIATDVGGTGEIFPPNSSAARLVPPGEAAALAGAMTQLLGNEGLRRQLAAAARRRAEEAFDARRAGESLVEQYRGVQARA